MGRRLTISLVLAMTFVVVLVAGGFYFFTASEMEQTFTQKMERTLSYLEGTLAPVLWNYDHDTAVRVAKSVLRDDLIVGLTITDEKNKKVFSAQEQSAGTVVTRTRSVQFRNKSVGRIEVRFSRAPFARTAVDLLLEGLLFWVLAVLSIVVLNNIFIRKFFRGPLASFTELARSYRQGPEVSSSGATRFLEFQPIEAVVKDLANDVFMQLREVRESASQFRSIFDNALYGIAMTGPDHKFVEVNGAWCKLIEYSREEMVGKMGIPDVTVPEDLSASMEMVKSLSANETNNYLLEKRYRTKSGKIIDALVFITSITGSSDEYKGSTATILDITERKRAEVELIRHREHLEEQVTARTAELNTANERLKSNVQEMTEASAKYHDLYENSPDCLMSVDVETGRIIECNSRVPQTVGIPREEIIGRKLFDMYEDTSRERAAAAFEELKKEGEVHGVQLKVKCADGSTIDVLLDAAGFFDSDGVLKFTRSSWTDISQRIAFEKTLQAANLRLQELDRLKSMFIASVSHELRTPLNSIIGFSGMVLAGMSGEVNDEQRDGLERVNRAGRHLLSLVSDVIDISKIEAGRAERILEPFSLESVVSEAVDAIQPQLMSKDLDMKIDAPSWPNLYTDRKHLLQCLMNYLSNALKYTEAGTITLSVREEGDWVNLSVADTGIGIAKEDIPRLFQAFERLDSSLRIKAGGTGLGLYLVRKIATDVLEGEVSVESKSGEGSVFALRVPRKIEAKGSKRLVDRHTL